MRATNPFGLDSEKQFLLAWAAYSVGAAEAIRYTRKRKHDWQFGLSVLASAVGMLVLNRHVRIIPGNLSLGIG